MDKPIKKILLLSMSAGAGHTRAAEALFLSCQKQYPEIQSVRIDIIDYSSWFFKKTTADVYHFLIKKIPFIYGWFYKLTDTRFTPFIFNKFYKIFEKNNCKLQSLIKDYKPDLIIATHFLIPTIIKKTAKNIPIDIVITDYGLHNFWLTPNIRKFYVSSKKIEDKLKNMGFSAFTTGIPLHPDFFENKDSSLLKTKYNIDINEPTILIMSGGFGLKNQSLLAKKILLNFPKINLLVISGKNNKNLSNKYKELKKSENINYQVFDFIEKIDELIFLSDIILTKPGGITLSECAFLNKKIILTKPIPGQEELNEQYFIQNNLAIKIEENNIINQIKNLFLKTQTNGPPLINPNEKILDIAIKNTLQ